MTRRIEESKSHVRLNANAIIVPFVPHDLVLGKALTDAEGWHRTTADWARLYRLEPEGAFKAVVDGKDAGTAAVITFDKVAWIHSVIVRPQFRGQGIGHTLVRHCIEFARGRGIPCIKLDSEAGAEPFYEDLGFQREFQSWRLLRDGLESPARAEELEMDGRSAVLVFDQAMTGLDRRRALSAILRDDPKRAFVVQTRGEIRGFVIVRRGERRMPIGPCVAVPQDPRVARDLLTTALASAPRSKFRMCVAGRNALAMQVAEDLGFTRESCSTRMFLGTPFEESDANVAMISAEKG